MSNTIAQELKDAGITTVVETAVTKETPFSIDLTLTEAEQGFLANLLSVRYKPREIEALAKAFPEASSYQLYALAKLKELAEDERIASVWRARGTEWKLSTVSYARQVFHEVEAIRAHAERSLIKLASEIPTAKHEDVIKWLQTRSALDTASSDERIKQVAKIFANA